MVKGGKHERFWWGPQVFSPLPPHTISPNWIENRSEKWAKIFGQNSPHFLFTFFFLPQPGRKCGLPTLCFFFPFFFFLLDLSRLDADLNIYIYDDVRICDTP